jgi:hypothetical protein
MFDVLKNLFRGKAEDEPRQPEDILRRSGAYRPKQGQMVQPATAARPQTVSARENRASNGGSARLKGTIEDRGPGKNVLVHSTMKREETGTHEKLSILDDSLMPGKEETGIDPYNTGKFDRSKNWDKRFRER